MDNFINYLSSIHPLTKTSIIELKKILIKDTFAKKEKLVTIGEIPEKIYFLESGLIRKYMISPKENEYNKVIFTGGDFVASLAALIKNSSSKYTLECLTDATVISCDYKLFIALVEENLDLGILHRKNLENLYIKNYNRNLEFLTLDAKERYLNLRKRIPNIDNLISQKQISNHLAITPIQLSRIRRKLITKLDA